MKFPFVNSTSDNVMIKQTGGTGTGRVFYNDACHDITWTAPVGDYETQVKFPNGNIVGVTDYDKRFDLTYQASDDGNTFYGSMVLLSPDEPDPTGIPTSKELAATAFMALKPLYDAGEAIDPSDIIFARNIFSNSAFMLRYIQKYGSVEDARDAVLSDHWYL